MSKKTPIDPTRSPADLLRGVFDGSIHQSEVKLELTSANDSNAFLLSFLPARSCAVQYFARDLGM